MKKFYIYTILLFLFILYPSISKSDSYVDLKNNILECGKISINEDKYKCFDELVSKLSKNDDKNKENVENETENTNDKNEEKDKKMMIEKILKSKGMSLEDGYVIKRGVSDLDDSKEFAVIIDGTDSDGKKTGDNLFFRCADNKTDVFLVFKNSFFDFSNDYERVTYRIDKLPPIKENWSLSTDHRALFVKKPVQFIKKIKDNKTLIVRATPYKESQRTNYFYIGNLPKFIEELQQTCKWK